MIYIATVHYMTDSWIDIQLRFIKRYIDEPFRIYACLDGIENDFSNKFYFVVRMEGSHSKKLDYLAMKIMSEANDSDILVFMDGDAFPIGIFLPYIKEKLLCNKLVAIQRLENCGDIQPHPAFCATTVGFWKKIEGDWNEGGKWRNIKGQEVTDAGGNLLKKLNDNKINWYPMKRSNKRNLHPVFFGIYEDIVYHHGAGFRMSICRYDLENKPWLRVALRIKYFSCRTNSFICRCIHLIGSILLGILLIKTIVISNKILKRISQNENFFIDFI